MEGRVTRMLLLIIINVFINRRVKVKGIPKIVEKHKMVGPKVVKSSVKGDLLDNNMSHKLP